MCKRFTIVSAKRKTTPVLEGTSTAEFQVSHKKLNFQYTLSNRCVLHRDVCAFRYTDIHMRRFSVAFFITSSADIF